MKHHIKIKTSIVLALLVGSFAVNAQVINRSFSSNTLVAGSPDLLRVQNGLIAHDGNPVNVVTGAGSFVGTFGATAKWIGIGAPVTPGNLLYGERTQWNEQAFAKSLRQRSTTDVTKDAILEWGGGVASQAGSEMQFRHITNPLLPAGFTRILTMNTAGNSYFGLNPVAGTPKLGVSTTNQYGFSSTTQNSLAGYFTTTNSIAGYFLSNANQNNAFTRGVYAVANGGTFTGFTAALSGIVGGNTATNNRRNYGVYGSAPVSPTSAFGNPNTSYAGFFQGDVYVTNTLYGSDAKYKTNVVTETDALTKILAVRPVTYNFDTERYKAFNFTSRSQHGFIAQELANIFPEAVQNATLSVQDETGKETATDVGLAINYVNLISVLFRGIQEQQEQINQLQTLLGVQGKTNLTAAEGNVAEAKVNRRIITSAGEFTVTDFKMEQNVPNPFSGNTVIKYQLPNKLSNAFIGVYNLQGTQLLRFDRLNAGGQVTINANTLKSGIYIYSLVAEGQEVMSRKMVVSK
jgi:hypothetical protein